MAARLLQLFSLFDTKDISEELFRRSSLNLGPIIEKQREANCKCTSRLDPSGPNPPKDARVIMPSWFSSLVQLDHGGLWNSQPFTDAIATLTSLSLIRWNPNSTSYSIHGLLHHALYESLEGERNELVVLAALLLWGALPNDIEETNGEPQYARRMLPHSIRIHGHLNKYLQNSLDQSLRRIVLSKVGCIYSSQGSPGAAVEVWRELVQLRTAALSKECPDTLDAMSNLADALHDQGKTAEGAAITDEVLQLATKVLGIEHPCTLRAMNNWANTLHDRGMLEEAMKMKNELLQMRTRILGETHVETLRVMNNLAVTLHKKGRLLEAAAMQNKVVQMTMENLGKTHPYTLASTSNLAIILYTQGRLKEAMQVNKEALQMVKMIMGEEHRYTQRAIRVEHMLQESSKLGHNTYRPLSPKLVQSRTRSTNPKLRSTSLSLHQR